MSVKAFRWMLVGPLPHSAIGWGGRETDFQRGEGRLTRVTTQWIQEEELLACRAAKSGLVV